VAANDDQAAVLVAKDLDTPVANSDRARRKRAAAGTPGVDENRKSATAIASPNGPAPSRPKPAATPQPPRPAGAPVVAKPVRAQSVAREAPVVPAPDPQPSTPVIASTVRDSVAALPTRTAPPPALGPFFEAKDVNEQPRVAARVEPKLTEELKARSVNEVVIVRVLVSQSGHPSRVSLLRRSRTGAQLDDVVVAAVNQWTFSPAKKKGEAVSCWFNLGVQVGQAD
jgi:TonB family protein